MEPTKGDDFLAVQIYEKNEYDDSGMLRPRSDVPVNDMGSEIRPECLAEGIRYYHGLTGLPIAVTEHGLSSDDDEQRCRMITEGLPAFKQVVDSGEVPCFAYFHWSIMDNFEWEAVYGRHLGLCSVDRATLSRVPKPSAKAYADLVAQWTK